MPPRPRPRPRPVPKPTSSSSNVAAGPSSTGNGSPHAGSSTNGSPTEQTAAKFRDIVVNDTDEMFMKNKNRSSKTWQKLEKINKEVVKIDDDNSSNDDSGADTNLTPRRRKRQKKDANAAPSWQRNPDLTRMLSVELADSSDDDVQIVGDSSTPKGNHNSKRKRPRSRSRSITPPPALPAHQIQNAKNVVRQALRGAARPVSPTIELDDSSDNIELQPEFRRLAERVREEGQRGSSQAPEAAEGTDEVLLTVKWIPHPLNPNGKAEEWQYKVDRTDSFRKLFEAVAEDAGIFVSNLILTHNNKRFYSSITCQTLSIWSDAAEFNAYEKAAFDHIQQSQKATYSRPVAGPSQNRPTAASNTNGPIEIDSDSDDNAGAHRAATPPIQSQSQESDADSEAEQGEKIKIHLRSAVTGTKDIALVVKPSIKCGSIVKAFIKKAGLQAQYPELFGGKASAPKKDPRLMIDGDKMENDTEIGKTDLEDGDKVDVVGL